MLTKRFLPGALLIVFAASPAAAQIAGNDSPSRPYLEGRVSGVPIGQIGGQTSVPTILSAPPAAGTILLPTGGATVYQSSETALLVPQAPLTTPNGAAGAALETIVYEETPKSSTPTVWVEGDYLLWWINRGPLPTPLVTTGNPRDALPGALGQPGTRALFGGSGLDFGAFSGGRLSLGSWINSEQTFGLEGGGFLLQQGTIRFAAASDSAGNPPIYLPVVNQDPASPSFGKQSSFTVADPLFPGPGGTSGNVAATATTLLFGAELNGLINLVRTQTYSLDGVIGFQYLDLLERLDLSGFTNDHFDDLQQTFNDSFNTRNQFYGGQLGARFGYHANPITLDVTGMVALGATHQVVNIEGSSFYSGTGFPLQAGNYPGGVYTQPSNIGRTSANTFSVVPQVGIKLGVNLTSRLTITIGYDFLYWSNVVRPGNQIDHNLNPTQFPGAGVTGPLLPAPQFNRSDFFVNGMNFGLTSKY